MAKKIQLTRRQLLFGAAVMSAGGILAACAPKAEPAPAPADKPAEKPAEPAKPAVKEPILIKYHNVEIKTPESNAMNS